MCSRRLDCEYCDIARVSEHGQRRGAEGEWVTLQRDGWPKETGGEETASKQAAIMKSFQFHPPTQSRFYPD
jgi:hypothetical protein